MPRARVLLHLPARMLDGGSEVPQFYRRLLAQLAERGAEVAMVPRDYAALRAGPTGADFDLVHNGGVARAQVLNLAIAYLGRFYYADPKGIYFESSLNDARFWPKTMPADRAAAFFARLQQAWVAPRRSRYRQPEERAAFGPGHIAVFLQDWSEPIGRARHMDAEAMVRAVLAHRDGRDVVVKLHPKNVGEETLLLQHWLAQTAPEVQVTRANVHDVLAGAAVSVSISSSVALEGMLHRVPAVLFGRSDLHHCAETVTTASEWPQALRRALARDWPFEAFVFWFLRRNCIDIDQPFLQPMLDRLAANGADLAALGLSP